ncbi:MAG TPA: hypothetical protein VFL29_04440 [Candidatus Dormibacteraeota bacterium]|nr:hypothetical protein [Candidatus Dormibacteraeota bacterium]
MAAQHVDRRKSSPAHRAAYEEAIAAPREHKPRLITAATVRPQVHGTGAVGQFNARLAVRITKAVGTMWAAYVFFLIALVSFPQALDALLHGNTLVGVNWLSQSFLQLVLLPIIIVGQNVISASQDARAEADHLTLTALHTMNVRQLEMLEQQAKILEQEHAILEMLRAK